MHMQKSENKSYPIKINRSTPVIKISFMLKKSLTFYIHFHSICAYCEY